MLRTVKLTTVRVSGRRPPGDDRSGLGLYSFHREIAELRREWLELRSEESKQSEWLWLLRHKTPSLFGYSTEGPNKSRIASQMSEEDKEASKTFSNIWLEHLAGNESCAARWSLTEQALTKVPHLLSYIPNSSSGLWELSDTAHPQLYCRKKLWVAPYSVLWFFKEIGCYSDSWYWLLYEESFRRNAVQLKEDLTNNKPKVGYRIDKTALTGPVVTFSGLNGEDSQRTCS